MREPKAKVFATKQVAPNEGQKPAEFTHTAHSGEAFRVRPGTEPRERLSFIFIGAWPANPTGNVQ